MASVLELATILTLKHTIRSTTRDLTIDLRRFLDAIGTRRLKAQILRGDLCGTGKAAQFRNGNRSTKGVDLGAKFAEWRSNLYANSVI